ncbi:acyltransferase family protein [Aerococcaceae bacterium WGS1372]
MRNYSIDSVRMLASLAVVFMHVVNYLPTTTYANYWTYDWYFPLLDLAVPIFFAFSGYFLYSKNDKAILTQALKILTMLIAYSLVYLLIKLPMEVVLNPSGGANAIQSIFNYFCQYSLLDYFIGIVGSEHLWFLAALFYAVIILYILRRLKLSAQRRFIIGTVLFLISFLPPINQLWDSLLLYGGFVKAYFYVTMGYMLAGRRIQVNVGFAVLIVSLIALVVFASNADSQFILEFFLAIVVFWIIVLCQMYPGRENILSRYSHYSLGIYFLHIMFTGIFTVVRSMYPSLNLVNPVIVVIPVFAICVLGSCLLFPLTERFIHQPLIHLLNKVFKAWNWDIYIKPS